MLRRRLPAVLSLCCVSLVSVSAWFGCAPVYDVPAPAVEGQYLVHVVHTPEETVKELAAWYTGSANNVAAIKAANPAIGSGALRLGRRVNIPLELVVKTEPPQKAPPTPTPTKLIVIPEKQPTGTGEGVGHGDELANLDDLDKFEEEIGPIDGKDPDSMNLGGAPVEPTTLPQVMPTVRSNVDQFESQVDQLLLKEQAELDKLQKEISAAQPATAVGSKK